jgi:hypothetical protein
MSCTSYLQLSVTQQGDELKLTWSGSRFSFSPYCVNAKRVRDASLEVRTVLDSITNEYKSSPSLDYRRFLKDLARAGEKLNAALFFAESSSAERVSSLIPTLCPRTQLNIFTDGFVQVPWSFVFGGDARKLPDPQGTLEDFRSFWTEMFKIRIRFNQMQSMPCDKPISKRSIRALYALHDQHFNSARRQLKSDINIDKKLAKVLELPVGETTDWEDCREKWGEIVDNDSILYIFGHSDGERIFLNEVAACTKSDKYALDTNDFVVLFQKGKTTRSNTLCFINGCRSADGSLGDGFLSVTSGVGFHGFIGAEAEVSNKFATQYATEFLYGILEEGLSVEDIFEQLRVQHFPLSLLYSCFADPGFQVAE